MIPFTSWNSKYSKPNIRTFRNEQHKYVVYKFFDALYFRYRYHGSFDADDREIPTSLVEVAISLPQPNATRSQAVSRILVDFFCKNSDLYFQSIETSTLKPCSPPGSHGQRFRNYILGFGTGL